MPLSSCLRSGLAVAAMLFLTSIGAAQAPDDPEVQLIEVLTSDASDVDKSNACRLLRIKGTEKSVPALAALLTDENLSHAARIALEPMPYESAGEALRAALEKTEGLTRVGIVTTLGNRRDEEAVPLLAPMLESDDTATRDAALAALAKIATPAATEAITAARREANKNARPKFDEALLLVANALGERGQQAAALALYYQLAEGAASDVDPPTRFAVASGVLKWETRDRLTLFKSMLTSDDVHFRRAAASPLATLPVDSLKTITREFAKLPPDSQIALLSAIRIRRVKDLTPVVIEAANSDSLEVQLAALRALGEVGDLTALPLLIKLTFTDGTTAGAAREALTRLHAPGVDDQLTKHLTAENDPAHRARWLELLVARNAPGIVDLLLAEATHPSFEVRRPAMAALARVASPKHLPAMTNAVLAASQGAERDAAEKAVMLVSQQIADPQQQAAAVLEVYAHATPVDQQALLPLLGRIGGDEAKQTILAIIKSGDADEAIREAAIRALANWPDASVADELSTLAKESKVPRHRQWALRAFVRVVSLPDAMPDDQKLDQLKQAIELAERDDERRLVLQRMGSVRTVASLRLLLPHLDNPELGQVAGQSITELAHHEQLRNPHKAEFIAALERVIATNTDQGTLERAKRYLQAAQE